MDVLGVKTVLLSRALVLCEDDDCGWALLLLVPAAAVVAA